MLKKGTKLNDTYSIVEEIGSGGGGVVYKAYHERLKTYVVVKQIREKVKGILESRAEADILKRIKHTYLPRVYDFLEVDGEIYTVMDYVPGRSLDKVLKEEKKIPQKQVLRWAEQLAEALDYLHNQTPPIIHSDIKPANIMLTPEENICLIDFNISLAFDSNMKKSTGISGGYSPPEQYRNIGSYQKFAGIQISERNVGKEALSDETATVSSDIQDSTVTDRAGEETGTQKDAIWGIEKAIGQGVDERSDIYSLGATLYHLLTGVKPDHNFEKIVPIDQYDLGLGKGFLAILNKMMQLCPEDRYQNGGELLYALQHIYELDDEYKGYLAKRRSIKIFAAVLWISGIFLAVAGIGVRGREMNTSYNRNVDAADMAIESGDFEAAREYVDVAKNILPHRIEAYEKEALLLYSTGDYEGTIRYISDIIQNPAYIVKDENEERTLADIYYIAGHSFMEMEDYSDAALNLEEAIRLNQNNSLYFRDYAISQAKEGNIKEAEAYLEEAVKLGLGEDSIYMVQGEISFAQNRYDEAMEFLDKAIRTNTDEDMRKRAVLLYDEIYRELGDTYLNEELSFLEQEESRAAGSAAGMNLTERLADAYVRKAEADEEHRQDYYQKALEKFLLLYENGYSTRQMMENIAIIYQELGEYEQTEEMLFSMAEQYPDSYISYKRLAYLEAEKQQVKENRERDYSRMKEYYDRAKELYGDQDTDQEMQMLDNLIQDLVDGNWLQEDKS
mgnify:CR=1 FL=1